MTTHHVVDHTRDAARLAEIERYGLTLDDQRPELTAFAELAALVCGVSSAFISIITETELLQVAASGFETFAVPRTVSMCDAVLDEDEPLVSSDLTRDPRFRDNPHVQSGRAVFYASYQLATPSGVPFGSLCVFDDREREISPAQRRALRHLADRVVDVLELELSNRELASTVRELERSNQQLNAFAGQVSHDLRNPLGAVASVLELLTDLTAEPEPDVAVMRDLVERAGRSTARMARSVEEVLQFATLGGHLDRRRVDVGTLVKEVCDDLFVQLSEANVDVGRLDDVTADPVQLRIVVQNLVSNAATYAVPGAPAHIRLSSRSDGTTWRLEVADRGIGVPPADRTRVFDTYVRAGSTAGPGGSGSEPAAEGTGTGLATARRIVLAHGGDIGLDETPGGGTTAWVTLPERPAGD